MPAMKPKMPALTSAMTRSAIWLSSPKVAKKLLAVMWMAWVPNHRPPARNAGHADDGVEQDGDEGGGEQARQHQAVERVDAHDLHGADFVTDPA